MLPEHGRISCQKCLDISDPGWQIFNNPFAWGARNPRILVLGVSKGPTQLKQVELAERRKEDPVLTNSIAFKGMRANLTRILHRLELLPKSERIDDRIARSEREFAFGSVVRCTLARVDPETGGLILSGGGLVQKISTDNAPREYMARCLERFLTDLPQRLEVVVLLSNNDEYVDACFESLKAVHSSASRINSVAYRIGSATFVHTVHAQAQGSHVGDWLDGLNGTQATKRSLAMAALNAHRGR